MTCNYQKQCSVFHHNNYECSIDASSCILEPIFKRITDGQDLEQKLINAKRKLFPFHEYDSFPLGKPKLNPVVNDGTCYVEIDLK
jgi:hypothetical protein